MIVCQLKMKLDQEDFDFNSRDPSLKCQISGADKSALEPIGHTSSCKNVTLLINYRQLR